MTAAARKPAVRLSALAVFIARAEARALLWKCGELTLHNAIDELWADAERDGLLAKFGPDEVQRLLADAFAKVRDDLPVRNLTADIAKSADNDDVAVRNLTAADDYDGLSSSFAALCRAADEKQRRKPPDPHLERLRTLMDDDVSLERTWHELNKPIGAAASTLQAAEFLVQQKDPPRLRSWLDNHTAQEREAILQHLEQRKRARAS
jgi:hypothetical protein